MRRLAGAPGKGCRKAFIIGASATGPARLAMMAAIAATLAACAGGAGREARDGPGAGRPAGYGPRVVADGQVPRGGGTYKIGQPYSVAGRWYIPREEPGYDRSGIASWYGADFHGRRTANGEVFDMAAPTAAHPTLPLPSYALVTNLDNGRTLLVRINDRGPYAHDRIVDLSRQSARLLGFEAAGTARVRVRYAGRAPLDGDDSREREHVARQPWAGRNVARGDRTPATRL